MYACTGIYKKKEFESIEELDGDTWLSGKSVYKKKIRES